jgi:hypothetical protein
MAHILHRRTASPAPSGHAATLSASRNYAISTRRRRFTRTARQSAGLVSAATAGLRLGRGTAPAERARQIAVWRRDSRRRKPAVEPAAAFRIDRGTVLARRRRASAAGLPAGDPVSSLARRTEPARPTTLGGSDGGVLRSRRVRRRVRGLSDDGRNAHPRDTSLRAVSPATKTL